MTTAVQTVTYTVPVERRHECSLEGNYCANPQCYLGDKAAHQLGEDGRNKPFRLAPGYNLRAYQDLSGRWRWERLDKDTDPGRARRAA